MYNVLYVIAVVLIRRHSTRPDNHTETFMLLFCVYLCFRLNRLLYSYLVYIWAQTTTAAHAKYTCLN